MERDELVEKLVALAERLVQAQAERAERALEMLRGARLGSEIAAFYKHLAEAGLPEGLAARLVEQYLRGVIDVVAKVAAGRCTGPAGQGMIMLGTPNALGGQPLGGKPGGED